MLKLLVCLRQGPLRQPPLVQLIPARNCRPGAALRQLVVWYVGFVTPLQMGRAAMASTVMMDSGALAWWISVVVARRVVATTGAAWLTAVNADGVGAAEAGAAVRVLPVSSPIVVSAMAPITSRCQCRAAR